MVEKWKNMSNEDLAIEYQQHPSNELFEYFAERNKPLTLYFAKRVLHKHPDWLDAVEQQGRLAIWNALKKFDVTRAKFSTYLYYFMLRGMQHQFREYHSIKLPFNVILDLDKFMKKYDDAIFEISSLDTRLINKDGDSDNTIIDLIASDDNIEDTVNNSLIRDELLKEMRKLSPREIKIITEYFGLDGSEPKTLQMLGDKYGVTRERIRQIIAAGCKKLRKYLKGDPQNVE